jgi:hypothetical protein
MAVQDLCSSKILEVLVVSDDINQKGRPIQIMPPYAEHLENGIEFLVMHIVIELGQVEGAGMESDWMDFTVLEVYREDSR